MKHDQAADKLNAHGMDDQTLSGRQTAFRQAELSAEPRRIDSIAAVTFEVSFMPARPFWVYSREGTGAVSTMDLAEAHAMRHLKAEKNPRQGRGFF